MFKRLLSIFITLSIVLTLTVIPADIASARERLTIDDDNGSLTYAIELGEAVFIRYDDFTNEVTEYTIPSKIAGYTVTTIGEYAFEQTNFQKITIPDTVKTIERCAFSGVGIKELIIPDSVTSLGKNLVWSDTLEKLVIGNGVKALPNNIASGCSALKDVTIGSNVEVIGESAFEGCTALESITIPSKVKTIESFAFTYCSSLKTITIPDTVTNLGQYAFGSCTSLEKAVIGNGITKLSPSLFMDCTALKEVTLSKNISFIDDQAFLQCSSLQNITIPQKVTAIENNAFHSCSSLKSIAIPSSVEYIDYYAFSNCTALETVTLGSGLKTISEGVFSGCSSLKTVDMKNGITEIGSYAFNGCISLNEVIIPSSLRTIKERAFSNCGMKTLKIGSGVETIEASAFAWCPNLESVTIPDNVIYIGEWAFEGCGMESLHIGSGVQDMGEHAFRECASLKTVTTGDGLKAIGNGAFAICRALESVSLSESIETIGNGAFSSCNTLKEITIPEGVTEITNDLFWWCHSLETVNLSPKTIKIGENAFYYCQNLKELYLPVSVKEIKYGAFENSGVKDVIYGGSKAKWETVSGKSEIENRATVHFGKKTENISTTTTKRDSIYNRTAVVYKNLNSMTDTTDNYVVCSDAVIKFDGKTYNADEKGIVPVPYPNSTVVVYAPGYETEVLNYNEFMNGLGIFLEKETDLPIIKSVKLGNDEIRRSSEKFTKTSKESFTANVDFNGNSDCEVYIKNGVNRWDIGSMEHGGYSATVNIGTEFNRWSDSFIVVEMADGTKISKKLNMGYAPRVDTDVVAALDLSTPTFGEDKINYIGNLKFDFAMPNFPFDITITDDKIVGTFGVDVTKWKYSGEKGEWDNKYNAHKALADVIKDSHERMDEDKSSLVDEWKKLKKDLGSSTKKGIKGNFGFDADIQAVGFIEGGIDERGVYFSQAGIIIGVSAEGGFSNSGIILVGPYTVPYNWEAFLKGKIEAQLNLAQREDRSDELSPSGSIGGSLGFKVGLGPGTKNIHMNFCIDGSVNPKFTYKSEDDNEVTVDAELSIYMEAVLGPYDHTFPKETIYFHLYPDEEAAAISTFSLPDVSEFTVIDRDYLYAPQAFAINDINEDETVIKTNTFKVSNPQMADLGDGKRLIVWVDDDLTANELNGRTIMYSYFDGESWSDAQYIEQDGMSDFNPQVKKVGNNVYLAWESVNTVLSDSSDANEMIKNTEIKYAIFNEETGKVTDITALTSNSYADTSPVINELYNGAVITWISNSESDIFTDNTNYSLSYAVVDSTTVTNTETVAENLNNVTSHIATGSASYVEVLYTAGNQLFSTNSGQLTNDENIKSGLKFVDGEIYLYNNGKLMTYYYGEMEDTGITLPHDRYVVSPTDKTVVYLENDGAASDVYAYFFDENEYAYGKAVKLTDMDMYLEDISGFTNRNGQLELAFNKRHILDDADILYGQSDLSTIVITPAYDISLDYAYADVNNMVPGYDTVIEADITNKGSKTINSVNIALYDNNEVLVVASDEEITLLPGESGTVSLVYTIPEAYTGFAGKVKVTVLDEERTNDNSYEISLICRDIAVDNVSFGKTESGEYSVYADIINGAFAQEQNIEVLLLKDDVVVDRKTIDTIDSFEGTTISFDNATAGNTYKVLVNALENETMLGNNDEFIAIPSEDDGFMYAINNISFDIGEQVINITADVVADTAVTESTTAMVALYNKQGKLVASKVIPIDFNNEAEKKLNTDIAVCEFDSAKIMLWGSSYTPLATVKY